MKKRKPFTTQKPLKVLIGLIITFLSCSSIYSQSADRIKYYILFDASGSRATIDGHHNLETLLNRAIKGDLRKGEIKKDVSFELIFFGESIDVQAFDIYSSGLARQVNSLSMSYKTNVDLTGNRKYTDINQALEYVLSRDQNEAYGVFIYTDGKLERGDVDTSLITYEVYLESVIKSLAHLNLLQKPVFLIQSSNTKSNPYFKIPIVPGGVSDKFSHSDDFFWVKNEVNLAKDVDGGAIVAEFEDFVFRSGFKIIKEPIGDVGGSSDDPIGAAMLLDNVFNVITLSKAINTSSFSTFEDFTATHPFAIRPELSSEKSKYIAKADVPSSAFLKEIMAAYDAMSAANISRSQIETIGALLEALGSDSNLRNQLEDQLNSYIKDSGEQLILHTSVENLMNLSRVTPLPPVDATVPKDVSKENRNLEEAIILGLSDYLIKRTKQEAFFIFQENIRDKILPESTFLKDTLFRNVFELLSVKGLEPNLVTFKEAVQQDIDRLPENLILHPTFYQNNSLTALTYGVTLINDIRGGSSIEQAFGNLIYAFPHSEREVSRFERGLLITAHLIEFLKQHDLSKPFETHTPEELNNLSRLALAYIASRYPEIREIPNADHIASSIQKVYVEYARLIKMIKRHETDIKTYATSSTPAELEEHKRLLANDVLLKTTSLLFNGIDLIQYFVQSSEVAGVKDELNRYKQLASSAIDAWFFLQEKNYARAVSIILPMIPDLRLSSIKSMEALEHYKLNLSLDLVNFTKHKTILSGLSDGDLTRLETTLTGSTYPTKEQAESALKSARLEFLQHCATITSDDTGTYKISFLINLKEVQKLYLKVADALLDENIYKGKVLFHILDIGVEAMEKSLLQYVMLGPGFKRFIAFAGEVSQAKSAGDIENALGKYALPVASYRIKRDEATAGMINAYTGGCISYFPENSELKFTLAAPIGIEHSWRKKCGSSFSLFAPIIDVGNVINYRLKEETDESRTILLENIVSPGLYAVWGLSKKFPFSIAVGGQANPLRSQISISFDLPLLRLW